MSTKKIKDGCLVHSGCETCKFSKCLLEDSPSGDAKYIRFLTIKTLKEQNINAKIIAKIVGVTPNHIYYILRKDWSKYIKPVPTK